MKDLELLGNEVQDVVTGVKGVVTSISFDISGCVQGLVSPKVKDNDPDKVKSWWYDTKRLKKLSKAPVMTQPDFVTVPGGQELPGFAEKPNK